MLALVHTTRTRCASISHRARFGCTPQTASASKWPFLKRGCQEWCGDLYELRRPVRISRGKSVCGILEVCFPPRLSSSLLLRASTFSVFKYMVSWPPLLQNLRYSVPEAGKFFFDSLFRYLPLVRAAGGPVSSPAAFRQTQCASDICRYDCPVLTCT